MTISYKAFVDWDGDGFFCTEAAVGDAPNLFTNGANMLNVKRQLTSFGTESSESVNSDRGLKELTYISVSNGGALDIGYDGTNYDISATAGLVYSATIVAFFSRPASMATWTLRLMRDGGALVATSAGIVLSSGGGYELFTVSGTAPVGTTNLYLQIVSPTPFAGGEEFRIIGPMMVQSASIQDEYNTGVLSTYENITAHVLTGQWSLGFRQILETIAPTERCVLTLDNESKMFSPENASGAIYAGMRGQRGVLITGSANGGFSVNVWRGWLDSIQPQPGVYSAKAAELRASGVRKYLDKKEVTLELQKDKTAFEVVDALLEAATLPGAEGGLELSESEVKSYDEVFSYVGDTWDEGVDVLRALADTLGGVQAILYFDRNGAAQVIDLNSRGVNYNLGWSSAVDISTWCQDLNYAFGDKIINQCTVSAYKRKASVATDVTLWTADETITLEPGETEVIRARFKENAPDDNKTVAGDDCSVEITAGSGVTHSETFTATSAEITLTNTESSAKNVTALSVIGQKLTAWNVSEKTISDDESVEDYGTLAEKLNYKIVQRRRSAKNIAAYRVARFGEPRGRMISVTIKPKGSTMESGVVTYSIGQRVTITDAQTGHSGNYIVIGEDTRAATGMSDILVTWFLEPYQRFFVLDDPVYGVLDAGNYLGVY